MPGYSSLSKVFSLFKRRRAIHVVQALVPILKPSDEFSFPSGHTKAAFMMAALVTAFFTAAAGFVNTWAAAVGLSRVMLKVHFVLDVLAGVAPGTLIAGLSLSLLYSVKVLG
jgi:undecaprenyl-diphosphatase